MRPLHSAAKTWAVLAVLLGGQRLAAQEVVAMDTTSLARGRYSEASTLLEKTIFRIDVARLRVRFGTETAGALEALLAGRRASEALADTAVSLAVGSRDAWASLRFERDVGFDRFLDGVRGSVEAALRAGLIDSDFAGSLVASFPTWYGSLESRGVREGDVMMYRIRGDTLRTVFQTFDGRVMVNQVDVAPQARVAVLGGFLSPGSDFREGLLRSLLEPSDS